MNKTPIFTRETLTLILSATVLLAVGCISSTPDSAASTAPAAAGPAPAEAAASHQPIIDPDVVFEEVDGLVAVEAEHFRAQSLDDVRAWVLVSPESGDLPGPDPDPTHLVGAGGGAYLEALPDTRTNHDETLVSGENFSNQAGRMAVLSYRVHFNNPGKYYVWVRSYSTGTEDNGIHVGLNGTWPESGQRWQTVAKNQWHWDCKQRTAEVHVGVPLQLFLEIPSAGEHTIQFSMREDGFEFDKWLMTTDRDFARPEDSGPASRVRSGEIPPPFPPTWPAHWGEPPMIQTRDIRPLPGGYGFGSSTLANWIQENLDSDLKKAEGGAAPARGPGGDGSVSIDGELKQWHKVTLNLAGPFAHERDTDPNPFTDHALAVVFTHESGKPSHRVPGYFAADGEAAETSAESGSIWRAHLSPDKAGTWNWAVSFRTGAGVALGETEGEPLSPYDGLTGSFRIDASDKSGRDFRGKGRLHYAGTHHLQFAGTGETFLKAGADAPETLLAYADFDNTVAMKETVPLKTWKSHLRDWNEGDPTWQNGRGKGLIGALNYLSGKGANAFSFLPYNAGGDGDNVWPFVSRDDKMHYDCSKLDQWGIVFDHATRRGLYLHFKLQENEIDDHRAGARKNPKVIPEAMDGGRLGPERKLYLREMIARYGHALALNWNLGEESTQTTEELRDMAQFIADTDPYDHHIVVHTFPEQQDEVYRPLLGDRSALTGASLQNSNIADSHHQVVKWNRLSAEAGKPWVVAFDEAGNAGYGMPPDPDYPGMPADYDGPSVDQTRKWVLWGALMAGGGGVEYYFGYKLPQNDLVCEDWRSRDRSWDYCRIALGFFHDQQIPVAAMANRNDLVGNHRNDNSVYCLAQEGVIYLVYLPDGGTIDLDLSGAEGTFSLEWFNPRSGGDLIEGNLPLNGGGPVTIGPAPADPDQDWLAVVRQQP